MDNTNISFIVIPDVHGRTFWKDAMEYIQGGVKTIFLGDYLDPYPHECRKVGDVISNFKDIINIARTYDNVELLIGNHDCGYMFSRSINDCRTIDEHFDEIRKLFRDNIDLFKFAYEKDVDGRRFLVTHAGVDNRWIGLPETHIVFNEGDTLANILNNALSLDNIKNLSRALGIIPRSRGGFYPFGSFVWQDINDWGYIDVQQREYVPTGLYGITQICGHTMQLEKKYTDNGKGFIWVGGEPIYDDEDNVYCLDCQTCFYVDNEGDVRYLANNKLVD